MTEGERREKKERRKREEREGEGEYAIEYASQTGVSSRKIWVRQRLARRPKYALCPELAGILCPMPPPYYSPPDRSRGAYLYGWRQEQAYVYVKIFPPAAGHHPCGPVPVALPVVHWQARKHFYI